MRKSSYKIITYLLIITFLTNFFIFGLAGNTKVEAGLWGEHKDSVFTLIKGVVMLYIMNLISQKTSSNDEGLITSTIRKGLNLGGSDETEENESDSFDVNKSTSEAVSTSNNKDSTDVDNGEIMNKSNESAVVDQPEVEITTENSISEKEQELVELVNRTRKEQGLQPLEVNQSLREIARIKGDDMIENNYFEHQSPNYGSPFEMMKQKGIKYSLAGENLAEARTVEKAFEDLMESPKHKENILEPKYDEIGIGIVESENSGLMIVQEFIDSPELTE